MVVDNRFTVIKDTREKIGWEFPVGEHCLGTEIQTLKTGDYTLKGKEEVFIIERKRSVAEISINVVSEAFNKEIERLLDFRYRFILCEFDIEDIFRFPIGSGIPQRKWDQLRITPKFLLKRLTEIQAQKNIHVIFAGVRGEEVAMSLFKNVWYNDRNR